MQRRVNFGQKNQEIFEGTRPAFNPYLYVHPRLGPNLIFRLTPLVWWMITSLIGVAFTARYSWWYWWWWSYTEREIYDNKKI